MTIQDFEKELKAIDPNLAVRPNKPHKVFPELEKIASVTYMGADLFSIPNFEIYDEVNNSYGIDLRGDGKFIPHRTRPEALMMAMSTIERINTSKDYKDQILGRGDYSDAALKSKDPEPQVELVDEVKMDLKEVSGKIDLPHENTLSK